MSSTTIQGAVIKSTGSWYVVKTNTGEIIHARIRGLFRLDGLRTTNPIAVGDEVFIAKQEGDFVIEEIAKRSNYIIRQSPKNRTARHIVASNLDQALLIITVGSPRTSSGFIDRFLTTAEAYHIPTILVFNKQDVLKKKELLKQEELFEMYTHAGYTCIKTSTETKEGLALFKETLHHKRSLLCGHSGVGKSSLVNTVFPTLNIKTGTISTVHEKGMHTTTFAEMHTLPTGGEIIDTPGIKEFGVLDIEKNELGFFFPEFKPFIPNCKFNNCIHLHEPQCAVVEALEAGEIHPVRYENYVNILDDLDEALKNWELK